MSVCLNLGTFSKNIEFVPRDRQSIYIYIYINLSVPPPSVMREKWWAMQLPATHFSLYMTMQKIPKLKK